MRNIVDIYCENKVELLEEKMCEAPYDWDLPPPPPPPLQGFGTVSPTLRLQAFVNYNSGFPTLALGPIEVSIYEFLLN